MVSKLMFAWAKSLWNRRYRIVRSGLEYVVSQPEKVEFAVTYLRLHQKPSGTLFSAEQLLS